MDSRAQKLWNRGIDHFRLGNLDAARASFDAFLVREPGSGRAWFCLSLVEALRGRHALAASHAERSLALDPGQAEPRAQLARCLLQAGCPERARAVALQAVAQRQDKPVVLDTLACVLSRLEEPTLGMELFGRAIELAPDDAALYLNRALAHRQFGQVDAAERDLEACLQREPGRPEAHWALANLRGQDLAGNHVGRLRRQLDQAAPAQEEVLALALFKELDDLGETPAAAQALARGLAARARHRPADGGAIAGHAALVDALVATIDARWLHCEGASDAAPVFVVGMPRSGVALLGGLLSRHPRLHWLGTQQAWSQRFHAALGAEGRALTAGDLAGTSPLDFAQIGAGFLREVVPAGSKPPIVCQSAPMDYLQVGFIARALPRARFVHVVRDPIDNCASALFQPGGDQTVADPVSVASQYAQCHRLMQHWHELLPGRMIDVSYESLVEKPEMMLRVLCSFLGVRYASALRMGLQLHARGIGRGHRYLAQLPGLGEALAGRARAA